MALLKKQPTRSNKTQEDCRYYTKVWKLSIYIYTTNNFTLFVAPPSTASIARSSRPTTSTYSLCNPTPCVF